MCPLLLKMKGELETALWDTTAYPGCCRWNSRYASSAKNLNDLFLSQRWMKRELSVKVFAGNRCMEERTAEQQKDGAGRGGRTWKKPGGMGPPGMASLGGMLPITGLGAAAALWNTQKRWLVHAFECQRYNWCACCNDHKITIGGSVCICNEGEKKSYPPPPTHPKFDCYFRKVSFK